MRRRARRRGGFTLLEMLIALAILGLAGAMAAQLLRPPSPRLQLESATRALCATLRAARARAIAENVPARVAFNLADKTYRSPVGGTGRLPKETALRLTVAHDEAQGEVAAIRFFPDGGATGGDIALDLAGQRATISVNWLTGGTTCGLVSRAAAASP
ncbi:MAG TPA: GspH/FimT family pseudopilin [Rhodoblastus sp.]|nr:GspH/FimT family pseudopilin [Rhodoblastus sp.]